MNMLALSASALEKRPFSEISPETWMYIGYASYVADDPATAGSFRGEECRRVAKFFASLTAEAGSSAEIYLMSVRAIIASYAGGIWRLRKALDANIGAAYADKDKMVMQNFGSRLRSGVIKLGVRLGILMVLSALGAALAQIFAPFIPQNIGEETGRVAPSVAGGAAMFIIGYIVSVFWSMYHQMHIDNRFSRSSYAAWEVFMKGRRTCYQQHLADLCEVWKAHMGTDYIVVSSIDVILDDDQRLLENYFRERSLASRGHLQIAVDALKSLRRRRKETAAKV